VSVIVLGGGAAGLMAAIFAARSGQSVTVVETRPTPGAKIRVSGGGRCNLLPVGVSVDDFHTQGSRNAMRNILHSWPLEDVRAFFERELGIPLKNEESGKVFPRSDRSRDVVEALLRELRRSGASLRSPCRVVEIGRLSTGGFRLTADDGDSIECSRLVVATGGLSLPKSGSDGAGMKMVLAMGHTCLPTYPALVPLLSSDARFHALSGVSTRVRISVELSGKEVDRTEGGLLFTHRGFSGPAILDVSHYVTRDAGVALRVDWAGGEAGDWDVVLRSGGRGSVVSVVRRYLPDRLATLLVEHAGFDSSARISELTRPGRKRLVDVLGRFELPVSGSEGYATAEVTGGGIPLAEISPATLESRVVDGLHLCGEIIDVTGRLGGYNFLWAWVTGRKVGLALGGLR